MNQVPLRSRTAVSAQHAAPCAPGCLCGHCPSCPGGASDQCLQPVTQTQCLRAPFENLMRGMDASPQRTRVVIGLRLISRVLGPAGAGGGGPWLQVPGAFRGWGNPGLPPHRQSRHFWARGVGSHAVTPRGFRCGGPGNEATSEVPPSPGLWQLSPPLAIHSHCSGSRPEPCFPVASWRAGSPASPCPMAPEAPPTFRGDSEPGLGP